jgi:preprotein translocase subunit SecY
MLGVFFLFRIYSHITAPFIDASKLSEFFDRYGDSGLPMLLGSEFRKASILMLGISPLLAVSLVMAMASLIVPKLERLRKSTLGVSTLMKWAVILSVVYAGYEALGLISTFTRHDFMVGSGFGISYLAILTLVSGYAVTLLLVSRLKESGLGSGIGLIVLASSSTLMLRFVAVTVERLTQGDLSPSGASDPWSFIEVVIPVLLLLSLLVACIVLQYLFNSQEAIIASVGFAATVIEFVAIVFPPVTEDEPAFIRMTRKALSSRQPLCCKYRPRRLCHRDSPCT